MPVTMLLRSFGAVGYYSGSIITYNSSKRNLGFLVKAVKDPPPNLGVSRVEVLRQVDEELSKGNDRGALSILKDLQGKDGGVRCFGAARQVPQRLYTLEELKLNGIDTSSLLSPVDTTLQSIERNFQLAAFLGGMFVWSTHGFTIFEALGFSLGFLFFGSFDLIAFNGGLKNLSLDTLGHFVSRKYHERVIQHEAGHFLMAYLLGVLPKGYALTSLDALRNEGSLNVQAGTVFVDFEFLEEINTGTVSATLLNRFSCIALAGVITEYLLFGYSEGGLSDINQLDQLFKSLGFTQKKADSQVRWAVLNTTLIMRRHEKARSELAKAMASGKSVGLCIDTIEKFIDGEDI